MVYHTDHLIRLRKFEASAQKTQENRDFTAEKATGPGPECRDTTRLSAHFCRDRGSVRGATTTPVEETMTNKTDNPAPAQLPRADQPERPSDHPNLSYLYGSIGIQAVAAAARYSDVREKPAAHRIDQRFVESAV
jgi:hypothetical protein